MAKKHAKYCAVKIGTSTVVGLGTWSLNGVTIDDIGVTAFGDTFKQFEDGLKDGGTISFDGWWDCADVTGQEALRYAQNQGTNLTTLRLYIDNTSYFEPCQTTGYWSPTTTSGADTYPSYVEIKSCPLNAANDNVIRVTFEAKVSGCMVLI
jgi:hypothetical protein